MNVAQVYQIPIQAAFKIRDAARYLGISPNTLRKRSDLGQIPTRRNESGERIFLLRDLDAYLESLPEYDKRGKPVAVSTNWNRTHNGKEGQN
jgi:predicted site-specific integrase-resolvase